MPKIDAKNFLRLMHGGASFKFLRIMNGGNIVHNWGSSNESIMPNTLNNPPMSVRLGVLTSRSSRPFLNALKTAWRWGLDNGNMSWDELISNGYMTAGGQLISIPPGSNGISTRIFDSWVAETGATGRWRFKFEGSATVDIYGSNVTQINSNEYQFDFTADGYSFVTIVFRTINPAGGHIRNISVVQQEDWERFDAGEIYRTQFLDEIRNYRCLRFDEWMGILTSEDDGGLTVTTWDSRALPTDEIFTRRFVPYEWQAALCNQVGADGWFCMPTAATYDHFTGAANLIRSLMPAPRRVYAEYSTKTWDFAGTPQAHYCAQQGQLAFQTGGGGSEFLDWYGLRSAQCAQAWKAVWTGDDATRLRTVVQSQCDWLGNEYNILVSPMWQARSGQNGLPTYFPPHTVFDVYTVHGQVDGGMAYNSHSSDLEAWRTTYSQEVFRNRMRDQMLTGQYFDSSDENQRNIYRLTSKYAYHRNIANTYGMELACYEVGNHLNGVGGDEALQTAIHNFSVSSQMGEVYTATINALRTAGFDGPLCFSVDHRYPDGNSCHGLQRWLGDHNPAWQAVENINILNNGASGRGINDFVGTYERIEGRIITTNTENIGVDSHSFGAFPFGYMGDGGGSQEFPDHWSGTINMTYAGYSSLEQRWNMNGPSRTANYTGALWLTEFADPSGGSWPNPDTQQGRSTLQYLYYWAMLSQQKGVKAIYIMPPHSPEQLAIDANIMSVHQYYVNWLKARPDVTIPVYMMPHTDSIRKLRNHFSGTNFFTDGLHLRNDSTFDVVGAVGMGFEMMMNGRKVPYDADWNANFRTMIDMIWDDIQNYECTGLGGSTTIIPWSGPNPLQNPNPLP